MFDLDLERCPNCDGALKIIAAILHSPVIEKILTHLGLPAGEAGAVAWRAVRAQTWALLLTNQAVPRPGELALQT